jgi:hypothetical protein
MEVNEDNTQTQHSGYVLWTKKAFGPILGFQSAYWGWVSSLVDNALYPGNYSSSQALIFKVMFVEYLSRLTGEISLAGDPLLLVIYLSSKNCYQPNRGGYHLYHQCYRSSNGGQTFSDIYHSRSFAFRYSGVLGIT